jgi:hypothetical protein
MWSTRRCPIDRESFAPYRGIMDKPTFSGSCACGKVSIKMTSQPKRVGLCHCMTCRKSHSGAFNPFAVFASQDVLIEGTLKDWESSSGYLRSFCPDCGSHVAGFNNGEVEVSLGSLDCVGALTPQYESWIGRREPWLPALPVPQYPHDRGVAAESGDGGTG